MSISFEDPMNDEAREAFYKIFGTEVVAMDERQVLLNKRDFKQSDMKIVANAAKQPAQLEMHGEGDIKTMSDGTRYKVTSRGWQKLTD